MEREEADNAILWRLGGKREGREDGERNDDGDTFSKARKGCLSGASWNAPSVSLAMRAKKSR